MNGVDLGLQYSNKYIGSIQFFSSILMYFLKGVGDVQSIISYICPMEKKTSNERNPKMSQVSDG